MFIKQINFFFLAWKKKKTTTETPPHTQLLNYSFTTHLLNTYYMLVTLLDNMAGNQNQIQ